MLQGKIQNFKFVACQVKDYLTVKWRSDTAHPYSSRVQGSYSWLKRITHTHENEQLLALPTGRYIAIQTILVHDR